MSEQLRSVGLDVGTTSSQMVLSRLTVENRASSFAVPDMAITRREILYQSPVIFTPLVDDRTIDVPALERWVAETYEQAGITPADVDTGAVIITGETARKDNARRVLAALSRYAGNFVVSTAGADLESVLAAKGAGAVERSQNLPGTVLHMDIGGGTSNLAWLRQGEILATGCLNVGGRLVKFDEGKRLTYLSPVLEGLTDLQVGDTVSLEKLEKVADLLVSVLEMAAGKREETPLLRHFATEESENRGLWQNIRPEILSFSGGVAECIKKEENWHAYGDLGVILGRKIRESALCNGNFLLGDAPIRATVIGAGCHSTQLSGSTVFYRGMDFPLINLNALCLTEAEQNLPMAELSRLIARQLPEDGVLALPGFIGPSYDRVRTLAGAIAAGFGDKPVAVCLEQDMAKALGQALALRLPSGQGVLCIDRVRLTPGSCLDVGQPVGYALPVVVKTLIFGQQGRF